MKLRFACVLCALTGAVGAQVVDYRVVGDGIPESLTGKPGVAARGKALLARREAANCLDCHTIKDSGMPAGGTRGPVLNGIGAVLTTPQLRLSVVDISRVSPKAGMPGFHTSEGLLASAKREGGAPRLSAQEIEDVVAYLGSLRK